MKKEKSMWKILVWIVAGACGLAMAAGLIKTGRAIAAERAGALNGNAQIEKLVSEFTKKTHCSSVSIVTYDKGCVSFYGDADGIYQIGSMTKAFTGLGIMMLVNEGRVALDKDVSDYLPGFTALYEGQKQAITIAELLTQQSGFTNSEKDYPSATLDMTLSDWVQSISGKTLQSLPGTEYAYSNTNYNLLGAVIEAITGLSYEEFITNEILMPLGMTDTYVGLPKEPRERMVNGSKLGYFTTFPAKAPISEGAIPAGYLCSTVKDLSKWISLWLSEEEEGFPDALRQAVCTTRERLAGAGGYCAGWMGDTSGIIAHSGGTAAYSSRLAFCPADRTGACVLTNVNVAASTDSLCNDILSVLNSTPEKGFSYDVWTIFDTIFSLITLFSIVISFAIIKAKAKVPMLICTIIFATVFASLVILLPLIFQADLFEILFKWAPWSVLGGLSALLAGALLQIIFLLNLRKATGSYENHHKKS